MYGMKRYGGNDLERYYPNSCPELGVDASNISRAAQKRHWGRYRVAADWLSDLFGSKFGGCVGDIGCGAGYGTHYLAEKLSKCVVFGVDIDHTALQYAGIAYGRGRATFWHGGGSLPKANALTFVESIEHMADRECAEYCTKTSADVVFVTTPIVTENINPVHTNLAKNFQDLERRMAGLGYPKAVRCLVRRGVTFTTGELGDQVYALFAR